MDITTVMNMCKGGSARGHVGDATEAKASTKPAARKW